MNKVEQPLDRKLPIIVIAGPTASGKTALAVEVARELKSEIISADSRQIYRHMDIGTAKPTATEMRGITHHALDLIEPGAVFSAGGFARLAQEKMEAQWRQKKIPVLVGGSGLYIKAVLEGLFEDEFDYTAIRSQLRDRLGREGGQALSAELEAIDPVAAQRLPAGDTQRLLRALEIALARQENGGESFAGMHQAWGKHSSAAVFPLCFAIGYERAHLYERINQRAVLMWKQGLVGEIEKLTALGYDEHAPGLKTMGYEEGWAYSNGKISADTALERIQRRTRQYAKRQLTWFRGDRRIRWLDPACGGQNGMVKRILSQTNYMAGAYLADR